MGWGINRVVLCNAGYKDVGQGYIRNAINGQSANLRETFPEMLGFSPRNLNYMRAFALTWPDRRIVQEVLAQITWYHNLVAYVSS